MAKADEKTIRMRAKRLAERDGYRWEHRMSPAKPTGSSLTHDSSFLSDAQRQIYLERARAEMEKEAGNA